VAAAARKYTQNVPLNHPDGDETENNAFLEIYFNRVLKKNIACNETTCATATRKTSQKAKSTKKPDHIHWPREKKKSPKGRN